MLCLLLIVFIRVRQGLKCFFVGYICFYCILVKVLFQRNRDYIKCIYGVNVIILWELVLEEFMMNLDLGIGLIFV